MKTLSRHLSLAIGLATAVLPLTIPAATKYVDDYGSFKPDGSADAPYKYLKQAAANTAAQDTIAMYSGNYQESRLSAPRKYTSSGIGIARIENRELVRKTVFNATHLNCHLSYCGSFIDNWADETRAQKIAESSFGLADDERPDFQGFCEIWSDWAFDSYINSGTHAYYSMVYGQQGTLQANDFEHSGLAMRSNFAVSLYEQHVYTEQVSPDSYAHKGWLSGTLTKDGITIHVIVTHTQANDDQASRDARAAQLVQLQTYIVNYRQSHGHIPVIVMGDFNVVGDGRFITDKGTVQSAEYPEFASKMRNGGSGNCFALDAAMNIVGGLPLYLAEDYTYFTSVNTLVDYFNPEHNPSWDGRLDYFLCYDSADGKVSVIPNKYRVVALFSESIDEYVCSNLNYRHVDSNLSDHYAIYGQFILEERR